MDRRIIHLHIPAFSIAVQRVCHQELRDRPVVVAPPHSERALILSASAEARKEGVFTGMPLGKAMKFCPRLAVLPPDYSLTEKASRALGKTVSRYAPLWEPTRPGHVYLDMTGTDRLWGRAKDAAGRLRLEIKRDLRLSGTVGVACNKLVSCIASRIIPCEGVLDVGRGRESAFMAPLRAEVLPGIGRTRKRVLLEELGITVVREIAAMDMGYLKLVFGSKARVIHQRALGIDPTPVHSCLRTPAISEETTLTVDDNDDKRLLGHLYGLVERCSRRLRNRGLTPQRGGVMFRYADHMEVLRRVRLPRKSYWDFDLYGPLQSLFLRAYERRGRVRFMRVWFGDFLAPATQLSLFSSATPDDGKRTGVIRALDRIREKYGDASVWFGRVA